MGECLCFNANFLLNFFSPSDYIQQWLPKGNLALKYFLTHTELSIGKCNLFFFLFLGVAVLEGPMYAVGGHDGWSYLNTVERWDPQARQWNFVASMSTPRSTVGVAILNGKYVKANSNLSNM